MSEMKEFGPASVLKNNVDAQRSNAASFRKDAEKLMERAIEADEKAEKWEKALEVLKQNGINE